MIHTLLVAALLPIAVAPAAAEDAAEDLAVLPEKIDGAAPKEMMHAYLMRAVHEALDRRDAEYEKLKTPEQLAAYQQRMREFFVAALGGFPERTPLSPKVVAKEDRDGYRIEKIIFQSQPRHFVTAVLYLPDAEPPYPGVLVPCGHSGNGKAAEPYQRASILLAKSGMAALCYDPIDQGERFQLLDDDGKPVIGGTTAHSALGIGSTLLGRNTATYRIWDGMRAIDYLRSREEVDPEQIGCTGNSGGGTLTSYLMALDQRIRCAAPSCYLTSLRRLTETIGPQDAEQNIHGQIAHGMDHADYVLMRAAKPTLMCVATRDYFDIDGAWSSFRQAKRFYTRLGFAERVDLIESDAGHGFNSQLRTGAVRWMRRWLLGVDDAISEPDSEIATDQQMLCTPGGQVMLLDGARSTYDLNIELEEKLAAGRKRFWKGTDKAKALSEVRRISGIREQGNLPRRKWNTTATIDREDYRIDKLILRPERGICLPALAFVPKNRHGEAYLYLNAEGKHIHANPGGQMDQLAKEGHLVLAVDLRGLGETGGGKPGKRGISHHVGGDWKDLYLAYLLGRSYLAMRAEDVLVSARFLAGYEAGEEPNRVHLLSTGRTGPAALHAAALEPQWFASVRLYGCLESWASVVRTPPSTGQFENVVHGALKTYDLPDLLKTLPKKKVTWSDPVDALGRPLRK
ncbi:MAG: alpha/beta hydrolase family protein [Planctomycetota bacterium]|jgi:cephalosporin-C deacetylase-like acetyl esterase